jgi:hypothetical protein
VRNFVTVGEGISHVFAAAGMLDFGVRVLGPVRETKISKKIVNKGNEIEEIFRAKTRLARNLARGLQ